MKNKKLYQDLKDYKRNNPHEVRGYPASFGWGWTPYKSYRAIMEEVEGNF